MKKILTMLVAVTIAIVTYAEDYNSILKSGRDCYTKQQYKEAVVLYEKAVKASKNAAQEAAANRMLAYSYGRQGENEKAAEIFEKISANEELPALTRLPAAKNAITYYSNAKNFAMADKVAEATKNIKSDKPSYEGVRFYGIAYSQKLRNQPEKALETIKKAKEKCQNDEYWKQRCDMLLIDILFLNKKYDELIKKYTDKAIENKKTGFQPHFYYQRAMAKKAKKDCTGAISDFQKTFEKSNNKNYGALYHKAVCLTEQKKYQDALKIYREIDGKVKSGWLSKAAKKQIAIIEKLQE